ncbi:DJ-1/PfpI family protein [Actinopolyspora lacussalsi subsp. righensis]|uniref:DJ-1/PfpI family protein n=1 Tax=Actinopolyspora righensis TaxID=995060 RepID=A0A1I6ZEA5_9ACTN|nr:DJ-1/PfpI family protein [Actinopolyspora righensis]SFT60997.1 DJ-1/PfpI family protein [Actinopolyspora righensis]
MSETHGGTTETRHIGILLFDGMEELDAVGPWEVFAWWTRHFPEDGYAVTTFSHDGAAVNCEKGLVVEAHHSMTTVPELEVLLHPGGDGTQRLSGDAGHLRWLREQRERVSLLTSVCTGSLVLAAGGLLRGRAATSNRSALERLSDLEPTVAVHGGVPYVDDGDVVTSAGIAAGIEMALHLVGRLAGVERARQVREGIEYAPTPGG